jgi:hypothetical protein
MCTRYASGMRRPLCAETNKRGDPCSSVAVVEDLCGYHAGILVAELRARIAELERGELREISLEELEAEIAR